MANLLEQHGATPSKQPRYAPVFIDKAFTGIYTQRNPLHDPSDIATQRFYGGRPDALLDGSNIELTNRLTLQRRPGLSPFSVTTYPTPPNASFAFELTDSTIQVVVDTGYSPNFALAYVEAMSGIGYYFFTTPQPTAAPSVIAPQGAFAGLEFQVSGFDQGNNNGNFVCASSTEYYLVLTNPSVTTDYSSANAITAGGVYVDVQATSTVLTGELTLASVANSLGDTAVYKGTITGGAGNAYAGLIFLVSGFQPVSGVGTNSNNGIFLCTASSSTTLTLENPNAVASSIGANLTAQSLTKLLLFPKSPGAGQTGFVAVAGTLYMGDGVDTRKYTPSNPNGLVWNYSISAPTVPPTVSIVESGSAAVQWQANTVFSTMGLLAANGRIEFLTAINVNGAPAQFGSTGNGQPNWVDPVQPGTITLDSGVTWYSFGQITQWQPNKAFTPRATIFDPVSGGLYTANSAGGTSGGTKPSFHNIPVDGNGNLTTFGDGNITWAANGSPLLWKASTLYKAWWEHPNAYCCEPVLPTSVNTAADTTQPVYFQVANCCGSFPAFIGACSNSGTSGSSYNPWSTATQLGNVTFDGNLTWVDIGPTAWASGATYFAWSPGSSTFGAVVDSNGNWQVCIVSHTASTQPTWGTNYGATSTGANAGAWVCVGSASLTWAASTRWFLPTGGYAPPTPSQPFGGALVVANSDVQAAVQTGKSGGTTPSWGAIGTYTDDPNSSGVIWYTEAVASTNSLAWTTGHVYAFSYRSRPIDDPYNYSDADTADGGAGAPPGYPNPLGLPTGSETNGISTAGPIYTITGANTGAVVNLSGPYSPDPQVDTIVIWRDADGGGSDNMFFLTEIPNNPSLAGLDHNGNPIHPWTFQDFLPDVASLINGVQYPGLNNLLSAPIDDQNDPPPSTFIPQVYNFQRIWGASGQTVPWSGGPDVATGNRNEAYNPSDEFPYLASVTRVIRNSQGLVVFLTDSVEFIGGGPDTTSFFQVTLAPGIGMNSFNAADLYAGEIFFISSDSQFKSINPSLQLSNLGFAIGDKIAQMSSSTAYVAVQQAGVDNAIYLADGATGWWRCNPHQVPGGANGPEPIWSPFATITNGCKMVQSIEVSPGIKKLLVGGTGANEQILERNLTVWTDNGTTYDAYFVMGSIVLVHPGQLALLRFLEIDCSGTNYQPTISYLLNEISGDFTEMPTTIVFDPPSLYGTSIIPSSYSPRRWYFSSAGSLARCRHLQLKVDLGSGNSGDEIFNLTIYGRFVIEL